MNFHRNQEAKTKNPADYCSMWFSKYVGGINLHLKKIYYYLDLPCVATVYLLIVNKSRVFCMKFFKNFISFLTYGFRTDTHSANYSQEK